VSPLVMFTTILIEVPSGSVAIAGIVVRLSTEIAVVPSLRGGSCGVVFHCSDQRVLIFSVMLLASRVLNSSAQSPGTNSRD